MQPAKTVSLAVLTMVMMGAAIAGSPALLSAKEGDAMRRGMSTRSLHAGMYSALDAVNYKRWRELTEGLDIQDVIDSEDDFNKLTNAHRLIKQGKLEEAAALLTDLGIEHPFSGSHNHLYANAHLFMLSMTDEEMDSLMKVKELYQAGRDRAANELLLQVRESIA